MSCEQVVRNAYDHLGVTSEGYDLSQRELERGLGHLNNIFAQVALHAPDYTHTDFALGDTLPGNGVLNHSAAFALAVSMAPAWGMARIPPVFSAQDRRFRIDFYKIFKPDADERSLNEWVNSFSGNKSEYNGYLPIWRYRGLYEEEEESGS